jgi:hypothetical protein
VYRSTSCGTLRKSGVSQLLPRLLSLTLQCGLFLLYTSSVHLLRWNLMVTRSTSSS